MKDKLKKILGNRAFLYLLVAEYFRFIAGYSLAFSASSYFDNQFPDYVNQFSVIYASIIIFGGLPASLYGGYLSDKYEE